MRLFTAIPVTQHAKDKVAEITRGRFSVPYINTTNLHITLNFFGELDLDAETKFNQQIHLTLKPNLELAKLQADLEKSFEAKGFNFQKRPYYPHIKLANLHFDKVMNSDRKLENFPNDELQLLNFIADRIVLYESKLLLHHPKYIPLLEVDLK